jgi:uncharacterized protein with HEPN domain
MPSDLGPLRDIRENIGLAFSFIGQSSFDEFRRDRRTAYAVTRCLEIVSEASRRLSPELKQRHPHIRWQGMAGAGNVYRHDYELIVDKAVWIRCMKAFRRCLPLSRRNSAVCRATKELAWQFSCTAFSDLNALNIRRED